MSDLLSHHYTKLAYLGALPFVACTLLLLSDIGQLAVIGDLHRVLSSYGLAIASFMAGVHWGQGLGWAGVGAGKRDTAPSDKYTALLGLLSNVATLIAWFAYLLFSHSFLYVALIAVFVSLLLVDLKLYRSGLLSRPYILTRSIVTALVVISLGLVATQSFLTV